MADDAADKLELQSTIGFAGDVPNGVLIHQDGTSLVYPLGCTLVVENIVNKQQTFLRGHTGVISCVARSSSGRYLASGQITHMGFKADVIVWDYEVKQLLYRLTLHKVKVQALAFSPNDKFLVTLGGHDDGSVVIWNLSTGDALCGSPATMQSAGPAYAIAFANQTDYLFVTGGDHTLRVWEIDEVNRKIRPTDCNLGQLRRIFKCVQMTEDDQYMYCGTTSGDVLQINISTKLFRDFGPQKQKFSQGVTTLKLLSTGDMLLATGNGSVAVVTCKGFKTIKSSKVSGKVTSLALRGSGHQFFVGTDLSHIYQFDFTSFKSTLVTACHSGIITDVVFPKGSSELFATSSCGDIRVWHASTSKELLRITVPNMLCHTLHFLPNGKAIVSGWEDGKIRSFYPESGRLMYTIQNAHNKGVTAIAITSDSKRIISGGGEGQVRVWEVSSQLQTMKEAMKEHKGAVTCIKVRHNDQECVSASSDGTCIIWDLVRFVRNQVIFANTLFRAVCYRPDECQIITGGTDRKIGYWETHDGSQIRELDGSKTGSINGMDITPDGMHMVTGGDDRIVKLWLYNEGKVTHVGVGHSGNITKLHIAPDGKHVVTVSADGGILRWKLPNIQ
ncbi:cilia- and flagella-associated protein 52-like [Dysidea avara]|uniref:cilia- and flagella-associated protein 52-like n=1 Tax=Dysidea avara TaxID=196820 RepID=UPI00331674E5